jgi:hypothetical protein
MKRLLANEVDQSETDLKRSVCLGKRKRKKWNSERLEGK